MSLPDFFLIGAAKAGTTALFYYLKQHPAIYACPLLEPNYFALQGQKPAFSGPGDKEAVNQHSITDLESYELLFQDVAIEQVAGEVSPLYLYHPETAHRISQQVPMAKLIVILRDPVERAYSSFLHLRRDGREPCEFFEDALAEEDRRIAAGWEHLWHYKAMGFYAEQLERYLTHFSRSQMLILLHDDFKRRPVETLQQIFAFLGIDTSFEPDMSRRLNQSGIPKMQLLQQMVSSRGMAKRMLARVLPETIKSRLVTQVQQWNLEKPTMKPAIKKALRSEYQSDVLRLQKMLQIDLSAWL